MRVPGTHPTEGREAGQMKNGWFWATVAAGAVAAYLMYRRGENFGAIARDSVTHPVGTLVREAQNASA